MSSIKPPVLLAPSQKVFHENTPVQSPHAAGDTYATATPNKQAHAVTAETLKAFAMLAAPKDIEKSVRERLKVDWLDLVERAGFKRTHFLGRISESPSRFAAVVDRLLELAEGPWNSTEAGVDAVVDILQKRRCQLPQMWNDKANQAMLRYKLEEASEDYDETFTLTRYQQGEDVAINYPGNIGSCFGLVTAWAEHNGQLPIFGGKSIGVEAGRRANMLNNSLNLTRSISCDTNAGGAEHERTRIVSTSRMQAGESMTLPGRLDPLVAVHPLAKNALIPASSLTRILAKRGFTFVPGYKVHGPFSTRTLSWRSRCCRQ